MLYGTKVWHEVWLARYGLEVLDDKVIKSNTQEENVQLGILERINRLTQNIDSIWDGPCG